MKKLAVIGASTGQYQLCLKAKEMGVEIYCFAWPQGAVCKDIVDHFIPISIFEMDEIVKRCREIGVEGVVTNASERCAAVQHYVAEQLNLPCTPYMTFQKIQNKDFVREATKGIKGLGKVNVSKGKVVELLESQPRPFVLKPCRGSAKRGVNFISKNTVLEDDIVWSDELFLAEQYISGQEYSVESISWNGHHDVIQITEKVSTGAPHFAEMEHHQPGIISEAAKRKVYSLIPQILTAVGYVNGASHVEIKVDAQDNVYLIEVNPRGGGDFISNTLVGLSTDCDYLKEMIRVALGCYVSRTIHHNAFSGVYFLASQSSRLLPWFEKEESWMYEKYKKDGILVEANSNYDHGGYIIYKSNKRINI